jgi:prepilin-type processing-associated H-X9-DG protein
VLAYSPIVDGRCSVLFADGSVQSMSAAQFGELSQRGLVQLATPQQVAQNQQQSAIMNAQLQPPQPATGQPSTAPAPARRAIRIELPRTGEPVVFTRALNIQDKPLAIQAKMMSRHTFQTLQWRGRSRILAGSGDLVVAMAARTATAILTVALALIIVSVGNLLINGTHCMTRSSWASAVVVALLAFLIWKYWPRQARRVSPPSCNR